MKHAGLKFLNRYAGRYRAPPPRPPEAFWADFRARALREAPPAPAALLALFPSRAWRGALAAGLLAAIMLGARFWFADRGFAADGMALTVSGAETPIFVWRDEQSRAMIIWVDDSSDGFAPPGG